MRTRVLAYTSYLIAYRFCSSRAPQVAVLGTILGICKIQRYNPFSPRPPQVAVLGTILGSLFLDLPTTDTGARSFFGASFMSMLLMAMAAFPQMPAIISHKP